MNESNKVLRISCPDTRLTKKKRIEYVLDQLKLWAFSEPIRELVELFNNSRSMPSSLSWRDKLLWLKSFGEENWDFRRKLTSISGEKPRWMIEDDEFIYSHAEEIVDISKRLGLIGVCDSVIDKPDYILILGGARRANLDRALLAKRVVDSTESTTVVVGLSAFRPILESERELMDSYAPNAKYEIDAVVQALNSVLGLDNDINVKEIFGETSYGNEAVVSFNKKYRYCKVFAFAAPSSQPESRRANSADCFNYFFSNFNVSSHSKIVCCTSQIYVPYQQVKALRFALDYNIEIDTIGSCRLKGQVSAATQYLQEIKATIDAFVDLVNRFTKMD